MSDVQSMVTATIFLERESMSEDEKILVEKAIRRTLEAQLIPYVAVVVD
jgi:hypothetical protein